MMHKDSKCKEILEFLQQNKRFGFEPKVLANRFDVSLSCVYNTKFHYSEQIESIQVSKKECYYLAKVK